MSVSSGPGDERLEILAVEDSPTQAELLRYLLEQSGYRVAVASTGAQALSLLDERAPSAIISDIIMPEMNGYELCRRVRADERTRDIPVILLTSLASSEDVLEGLACGADSFITKPYSKQYLITNIQQVLANRQQGKGERPRISVEISIAGKTHSIAADQQQMLTMLLSTYEAAAHQNAELREAQEELRTVNERLEERVRERTAALEADIIQRKQAEAELVKHRDHLEELVHARTRELELTNTEMEAFSYTVAHDLKNPLAVVLGFAELLIDHGALMSGKDLVESLDAVSQGARKMDTIIEELLLLAGVRKTEVSKAPIDMAAVVKGALGRVAQMVTEHRPTVVQPESWPTALGHAAWVEEVWANYLSNAMSYGGRPPRLELGGETVGDKVQFWVRDNGQGLNDEQKARLFAPFTQVHQARTGGQGLGLSIVRRIMEKLDGEAWVESEPGKGSRFGFTLPRAPAPTSASTQPEV
jgi:signal transduction histidine kinase